MKLRLSASVAALAIALRPALALPPSTPPAARAGTAPGTFAAGNDPRITGSLQSGNNLGDVLNPQAARTNLGLPSFTVTPTMSATAINAVLAQAAAKPGSTVEFVTGSYALSNTTATGCLGNPAALMLTGSVDVTIDTHGSVLQHTGTDLATYGATFCHFNNVRLTIKNSVVDMQHLPFAQATLLSTTPASGTGASAVPPTATFAIDPAYAPTFVNVQRLERFNPNRPGYGLPMGIVFGDNRWNRQLQKNTDGTYTLTGSTAAGDTFASNMYVGSSYLLESQLYGAEAFPGANDVDLVYDNVRVHSAAGMGFIESSLGSFGVAGSNGFTFRNGSGVFVKPGTTRAMSTNADCLHLEDVRGTVHVAGPGRLEGCRDDALNVYGYYDKVAGVGSATSFTVNAGHSWALGDLLQAVDANGVARGLMIETTSSYSNGVMTIGVNSQPAGFAAGWTIQDLTNAPDLTVETMDIGANRGRGVLAYGRTNLIQGVRFHDIAGSAAIWAVINTPNVSIGAQGPYPQSLSVLNDKFERVNYTLPSINGAPAGDTNGVAPAVIIVGGGNPSNPSADAVAGQILNVGIHSSVFDTTNNGFIFATSTGKADVSGNTFSAWGLNQNSSYPHGFQGCAVGFYATTKTKVGPNTYLSDTPLVRVCDSAANPMVPGDFVNLPEPITDDGQSISSANTTLTATWGTTRMLVYANGSAPSMKLVLPPMPSNRDPFCLVLEGQTISNPTVTSPDRGVGQDSRPITNGVEACWGYIAPYAGWYRQY